jgi:acetyl esterase
MATGRRLLRGVLAATALVWAAVGLLLGLGIVLPTLVPLFPLSLLMDQLAMLVGGFSLWLTVFALLGLGLAALARRAGFRRSSLVAAVLGVVTVALSLVPVVQGWRTASQEGVPLSLSQYFAFPSISSPETVTYARPEGEELKLDVRRPPDQGSNAGPARRPAVVTVHGGGGAFGGRNEDALWSEWLAKKGYVVFSIDYRLADYGPGYVPRWQDATGDVKCAVGWVKENADRYGVDPDRIALMGRSAGGHLALLAAYTEGDPRLPPSCGVRDTGVAAVAAFYSLTDQMRFDEMAMQSPWWRPNLMSSADPTGGTPESEPERRLGSPTTHVDPGDPPTFLTHGGEDQWSPPEQSELLENRLEESGVAHRLLELPWARHAFDSAWGSWGQQIVGHELGEFLEKELPG